MREEFRFGSVLRLRSAWASRRGDQGSEISDISDAYNLCVYVKIVQIVKLHDLHDVLVFLVILKFFFGMFWLYRFGYMSVCSAPLSWLLASENEANQLTEKPCCQKWRCWPRLATWCKVWRGHSPIHNTPKECERIVNVGCSNDALTIFDMRRSNFMPLRTLYMLCALRVLLCALALPAVQGQAASRAIKMLYLDNTQIKNYNILPR